MKKYEYKIFEPKTKGFAKKTINLEDVQNSLNELGAEGWELVSIVTPSGNTGASWGGTTSAFIYHLKREIN